MMFRNAIVNFCQRKDLKFKGTINFYLKKIEIKFYIDRLMSKTVMYNWVRVRHILLQNASLSIMIFNDKKVNFIKANVSLFWFCC